MLYVVIPTICYLLGAFSNASFNLAEWNSGGRAFCAGVCGVAITCVAILNFLKDTTK